MTSRAIISRVIVPSVCLAAWFGIASVASACPSCQQALSSDSSQGDLARGIYYSILFMMSMPFAIAGAFGGLIYRAIKVEQRRKADADRAQDQDSQPEGS